MNILKRDSLYHHAEVNCACLFPEQPGCGFFRLAPVRCEQLDQLPPRDHFPHRRLGQRLKRCFGVGQFQDEPADCPGRFVSIA